VSSFVLRGVDVTGPIRSRQSASPGVIELWMSFVLGRRQDVVGVVERVTSVSHGCASCVAFEVEAESGFVTDTSLVFFFSTVNHTRSSTKSRR
jgi:hypothetical protein